MKTLINIFRRLIVMILFAVLIIGGTVYLCLAPIFLLLGFIESLIGFIITYLLTGKNYCDIIFDLTWNWEDGCPNLDLNNMCCQFYSQFGRILHDWMMDIIDIVEPE